MFHDAAACALAATEDVTGAATVGRPPGCKIADRPAENCGNESYIRMVSSIQKRLTSVQHMQDTLGSGEIRKCTEMTAAGGDEPDQTEVVTLFKLESALQSSQHSFD